MNQLAIRGFIKEISDLRYSPSGVPILEIQLMHESEQVEAGITRKVSIVLDAIIIGQNALGWQHAEINGKEVDVVGFLAQKHQKNTKAVLHIQSINFSKG